MIQKTIKRQIISGFKQGIHFITDLAYRCQNVTHCTSAWVV